VSRRAWPPLTALMLLALMLGAMSTDASSAFAGPVCRIANLMPLVFDAPYDPFVNAPTDGRVSFSVTCSHSATTELSLIYSHHMSGGSTNGLRYDLFATPDRATVWGSGSDGETVTRSFPAGTPTTVYVYARIPPHQKVPAGRFDDSFFVTTL
jgi:spore coat protein U-like protein